MPARIKTPDDKPGVEGGVRIITQNILIDMQEMSFFSLEELNEELFSRVKELNKKPFAKQNRSREEIFIKEEKPMLIPLPLHDFIRLERIKNLHSQQNYC